MIDRKWIGHEFPPAEMTLERGRLRFFAKAIGETDPVYTDLAAARAAGHADLPAPPTFLFGAELEAGTVDRMIETLCIPVAKMLHGEQSFTYLAPVCAGETLIMSAKITDIFDKKNGALEFVVKTTEARRTDGGKVAEMRSVLVLRTRGEPR